MEQQQNTEYVDISESTQNSLYKWLIQFGWAINHTKIKRYIFQGSIANLIYDQDWVTHVLARKLPLIWTTDSTSDIPHYRLEQCGSVR